MASTFAIALTALIPFTSLVSFSGYLTTAEDSPLYLLLHRRGVQLPTNDGSLQPQADPFEIEDPVTLSDGVPVREDSFWRHERMLKIWLLVSMVPPVICNICLLIFSLISSKGLEEHERARTILLPILLTPAHVITVVLALKYLGQNKTSTHWPTTWHLFAGLSTQFIILTFLAILPSTPYPRAPTDFIPHAFLNFSRTDTLKMPPLTSVGVLTALLPVFQWFPLWAIISMRRGPPLHMPMKDVYPAKVVESIPPDAKGLDPTVPNVSGEAQVTVVEWFMFSYASTVIDKAKVSDSMDVWDLPILMSAMRAFPNYLAFKKVYGRRRSRLGKWEGYNLLLQLAKVNARLLTAMVILTVITAVGYYAPHKLLQWFIEYLQVDPGRTNVGWGWVLAFGLFISNAIIYILSGLIWSISSTYLQGRFKLQLNTMLYAKTLRKKDVAAGGDDKGIVGDVKEEAAKAKAKKERGEEDEEEDEEAVSSKSQIMTLFTVDVDRVSEFIFHLFTIIDAPIEILVATGFLFQLLGTSALWGLLATLISMPLTHVASKIVVTAQDNLMKARDQRSALMNELLQAVRMVKFMAWERPFERRVNQIRRSELSWQARNYQIEVLFNCIWALTPVMVTIVAFMHYTLVRGEKLTPAIAFTSIAVFDELRFALNALPEMLIQMLQGFVSCRRIEKYMSLPEVPDVDPFAGGDIVLRNATYTWAKDESKSPTKSAAPTPRPDFSLADLSLCFPAGKLSLICGRLGSGKTLLLSGLLGEADLVAGQVEAPRSKPDAMSQAEDKLTSAEWIIKDNVAYVPQQAWLQNATIKDNIIFSSPWDPVRYAQVIEACSLTTDLEILEDGDETEIGEKGLNLSGGQKARVSLARAVYSRAGVLYLDDVLSAVDAHTAHFVMENCLQGPLMADRTILLVSHHTALVSPGAAYIVALENGDVKFAGTRAQFVECGLMKELDAEDPESQPTAGERAEERTIEELPALKHKSVVSLSGAGPSGSEPGSETSSITDITDDSIPAPPVKTPRKLIEDEKRVRGRIAWSVWQLYFRSLGGPMWWICFIASIIIAMLVPVAERGWVKYWAGADDRDSPAHTAVFYVVGYAIIAGSGCILDNVEFAVTYIGSLRASRLLHAKMLQAVLFAPLRFHDTTSRGRILNRFAKDIEGLDSSMADNFVRTVRYGCNVAVTLTTVAYFGGWPFMLGAALTMIVYYRAGSVYGQASRDMRRLDSVTRSPLYSLFGETVSGVAVLRAFGASTVALSHMMRLSDTNILCFFWTWTINRWLSARFNILSSALVGLTAAAMLMAPVSAATAGFALAFVSTVMHNLLFVVRRFVQLEQSMVALERIKEYSEIQPEAAEYVEPGPPEGWPAKGEIEVKDLVIKYAPDLPDVLHGLTFNVKPGEKVGIVGSTGCGKSTLALSFFRFVEATKGSIVIDDVDISTLGLTDLRSRIMIIPQDPTILSGTLRNTLDVFDEYSDAEIYEALRRVHLLTEDAMQPPAPSAASSSEATVVGERNANVFADLNYPVTEGGDNFSTGEKQLLCMARAILRRNKILLMDEATASIDAETDTMISETIRTEFTDSTILTIAHRLHTIIDFDTVIVMDKGSIAEMGSPYELLRKKGRFYKLCKATGKTEFAALKESADKAEERRKNAKK
ncbi:hypothetical protein A1Q2_02282 [Trichosporon asahii var. asahii CBS 8904]|uniref:ATP-binding cassette transporter n=1 Tax=Trichosporon asahii var. asahii (strain CBS 8904) TaxID=1220162 RepID=K1VVB1_TRIAC|nr:hypothetical protein A1Q2_02282 [Trichosporon asahii var. asahii CBS 8904]